MTTSSGFKNFAVLTVHIHSVEQKIDPAGQPYALASAALPMEARRGASQGESLPLHIVALKDVASSIVPGQFTLVGRLGYEEYPGRQNGPGTAAKEPSLAFFPAKVEPAPGEGQYGSKAFLHNYVSLTLRAGQDAEGRYTDAGHFWTRVRMALGQGKDPRGNYRPSLWMTVKGFTSKEGDDRVPRALDALHKGALATVAGRLVYELSTANGKGSLSLIAFKVEAPPVTHLEAAGEDCPY